MLLGMPWSVSSNPLLQLYVVGGAGQIAVFGMAMLEGRLMLC